MIDIKSINEFLDDNSHFGILILRFFIGGRLIYGVIDNVLNWGQMMEFAHFLENNGFPFPTFSAVLSVYVQFIGAVLILVGYKVRIASFLLVINFLIALIFVHLKANDSIEGMTPALAMLFGCLSLLFTGADKLSIEGFWKSV